MPFDVMVVGGSYAGISAAMQVARARRKVLVVDAGSRRNRFAVAAHGFLGGDGRDPAAIAASARKELLAYPSVTWVEDTAVEASSTEHGFALRLHSGAEHVGRRVILATGVVDELPAIPGITERWGKTIFHCPYCHGYELDQGRIGVLATTALSIHAAIMLPDWGPTTYFTQGIFEPEDDKLPALERRHVGIEREPVTHIGGEGRVVEVHLRDGRVISLDGLFLLPKTRIASPIPAQLGCELDDGPHGTFLKTDPMKETSVRGVFACGDAALPAGSVAFAVGDGARAGIAAHQSLVFR